MKFIDSDAIQSAAVHARGVVPRQKKSPDEVMGELLADVQSKELYPDAKTFVDMVPRKRIRAIEQEYKLVKQDPHFDLREFVARHFYDLSHSPGGIEEFVSDPGETVSQHITRLWPHLERCNRTDKGTLMALPHAYIVPGGRFNEQFYWDSYFIMLGLAADGEWKRVEKMVKNVAYMIRTRGYVPTANRTYFLSRSQPPVFALMVRLLAGHKGRRVLREYLPQLMQEYRFWMRGVTKLKQTEHLAYRRLVRTPVGVLMNRYYDNKDTPRSESLQIDKETAAGAADRQADRLFLHLRTAAESGWDFSARWFRGGDDLDDIHAADILPVDLNCLLYLLEETIADAHRTILQPILTYRYHRRAQRRKQAIGDYMWSEASGFYTDYNFHHHEQTGFLSLAGVFPLFAGIASIDQARHVARRIEKDFLKAGGLVTTTVESGQQWDSPNGWAPLQWVAVEGLRRYGYDQLADEVTTRWTELVERVYKDTGRIVEKYNVVDGDGLGGGGEYTLQDGFGWTNGVYQAFKKSFRP